MHDCGKENWLKRTFLEEVEDLKAALANFGYALIGPIRPFLQRCGALPHVRLISIVLLYGIVLLVEIATVLHKLGMLP